MAEHTISHFRNLWQKNMLDLEHRCKEWEKISNDNPIPDDVKGEIRTAIGLARLLMNQKLKQFKGLIDDSEFKTGEKEITCTDLEGFWDMVYFEVEKIQKTFTRLNTCKNNDWKFIEEISVKQAKKIPVKKDIAAINNRKEISKAQALAARQRVAELRKKMAAAHKENKDQNKVDILLSNTKGVLENSDDLKDDSNIVVLNDKTFVKESNEKRKSNYQVFSKKSMPTETNDLSEESSEFKSASKPKTAQKKKVTNSNKENVLSDLKHTPAKQGKFNESAESKKKSNFVKLQCITRSAAKRALLLQQNSL